MQAQQPQAEQLLLVDEVPDVGAREARAGGAGAVLVERARVAGEAGVAEVQPALPGERGAGARDARRQDAVEHVDPALDHLEDALRVADAHEVARPGRRGSSGAAQAVVSNIASRGPRRREARRARSRRSRARRSRRSSGGAAPGRSPPWAIPNRSWPGRARRCALARGPDAWSAGPPPRAPRAATPAGGQTSRHIAMSEPSCAWICGARSGVKRARSPS